MLKILMTSAATIAVALAAAPAAAQNRGEKIEGSYICVLKAREVGRGQEKDEAEKAAKESNGQVKFVYDVAIKGFALENVPAQAIERIKANNPKIAYCEQDQVVTLGPVTQAAPPTFSTQAEETPWGIARAGSGDGTGRVAWVIDTGIAFGHPDLNIDTNRSRSFVRDTSANDQNGHGTHVAGTIAARSNNNSGVYGVAANATVVAVRVLDRRGSGSNSGVIAGVNYVASNGKAGDVANMSLGGGVSQALDDAVITAASKGVKFALAAGNESDNVANHSPGRANGLNVYTVSAFSQGDRWASFSNFGNGIDYAEPGVGIKSTWLNGGYNTISGTSMATPHLAGLLLLGTVRDGGTVTGDPDGIREPIGVK